MNLFHHRHDFEAITVEHYSRGAAVFVAGTPMTLILWRCKCKTVESEEILGKWTLAQVRGERELTPTERAEIDAIVAAEASIRG